LKPEERNWQDFWWKFADEHRNQGHGQHRLGLIREAVNRGIASDTRALAEVAGISNSEIVDPLVVADFAVAYMASQPPARILDPWAGLGTTLSALSDAGHLESGLAIEFNTEVFELARDLSRNDAVEWRLGDASTVLGEPIGKFDLVVGSPPVGLAPVHLEIGQPQLELTASKTYTMLVQAALALEQNGSLIAVLPETFFAASSAQVRMALAAASVYPSAALALPTRGFPTSLPLSLVVMTHTPHETLFAGALSPATDMSAIVDNLHARRDAKLPQLGRLLPIHEFVSWPATLRGVELHNAARTTGLQLVPIADVCSATYAPRSNGDPFDISPNAVYLPKLGTSPAVTSLDSLVIKPHNYLQLIVRPEVADPEFVAALLSSPLGRKLREQLATGTTIPQISLTSLRAGHIMLPPRIDQQRVAVRTSRKLGELQQTIQGLNVELWEHPLAAARTEANLRTVLEGGGMERWAESLPFPLASVLWRYHAEADVERRCKYLVHFFEGATVFLVDLHVSALRADPQVLAETARAGTSKATYTRGSIGIWADLLARLAARSRDLKSSKPALAQELYRLEDLSRLDAIARKSVIAALKDEAASYRRDWVGHAAVVGPEEWHRRLARAETTLSRIRNGLGDVFDGWELVRAGAGSNHAGIITTSIERLVGSRSLFRKTTRDFREWPEEGHLYMIESGGSLPLRLGPLFTLQRSPESVEDACYFYDRLEASGVRWVSYHFEPQPEVVRPVPEVIHFIEELNRLG